MWSSYTAPNPKVFDPNKEHWREEHYYHITFICEFALVIVRQSADVTFNWYIEDNNGLVLTVTNFNGCEHLI